MWEIGESENPDTVDSQNRTVLNPHRAGYSILATNYYDLLFTLYGFNTVAYCSSLSVILLVVSGFSSTNKFFAVILLAADFAILTALATYNVLLQAWVPSMDDGKTIKPYASMFIICLFGICVSTKYLNFLIRSRRRFRAASSAVPVGDNNTSVV